MCLVLHANGTCRKRGAGSELDWAGGSSGRGGPALVSDAHSAGQFYAYGAAETLSRPPIGHHGCLRMAAASRWVGVILSIFSKHANMQTRNLRFIHTCAYAVRASSC